MTEYIFDDYEKELVRFFAQQCREHHEVVNREELPRHQEMDDHTEAVALNRIDEAGLIELFSRSQVKALPACVEVVDSWDNTPPSDNRDKLAMPKIFICYRRVDSEYPAHSIYDTLVSHFSHEAIFFDVDSIPLGMDFHGILNEAVAKCDVLLAVIGDLWLDVTDDLGRRRLDDPDDFVRIEIEAALSRNIPVIPVLVGRATVPKRDDLPHSLHGLVRRQATEVRAGRDLRHHLERLVRDIEQAAAKRQSTLVSPPTAANVAQAEPDVLAGSNLSAESKKLLIAAAAGDGQVLHIRSDKGRNTQVGNQILNEPHDSRSEAVWEQAIKDLVAYGLLIERGHKGQVFEVTAKGYEVADVLQKRGDPKPSITTDTAVRQSNVGSTTAEGALARLKRYVVDDASRIELEEWTTQATEQARQAVFDPEFLRSIHPITKESLVRWLKECDARMDMLLHLYINGCRWGKPEHHRLWIRSLERLGSMSIADFNNAGGSNLTLYPALLLVYGGGIAAVAADDYALINGLLSDATCSMVTRFGSREQKAASILTTLWDYSRMFMVIEPKSGYPVSNYLCNLLRGPLRPIEPDERRYANLFDRFEYLAAICYGDALDTKDMPIGRFGRQFWYPEAGNTIKSIDAELQKHGDHWAPLKGGICGGSMERFLERKRQLDESIKQTRRC